MNNAKHAISLKPYRVTETLSTFAYARLFRWGELRKILRPEIFVAIILC